MWCRKTINNYHTVAKFYYEVADSAGKLMVKIILCRLGSIQAR